MLSPEEQKQFEENKPWFLKKCWVAREKDGSLNKFENEPIREEFGWRDPQKYYQFVPIFNDAMYPEITWESGPKEVDFSIFEDDAEESDNSNKE